MEKKSVAIKMIATIIKKMIDNIQTSYNLKTQRGENIIHNS